jgi:hypothetical protein
MPPAFILQRIFSALVVALIAIALLIFLAWPR